MLEPHVQTRTNTHVCNRRQHRPTPSPHKPGSRRRYLPDSDRRYAFASHRHTRSPSLAQILLRPPSGSQGYRCRWGTVI